MLIELLILWGVFSTGLLIAALLSWRINYRIMLEHIEAARKRQANAHAVARDWQDAYEEAGQAYQLAAEENQTLRRLLAQQLDAVRKASHALSPSDEWLAMLSKIEDEA